MQLSDLQTAFWNAVINDAPIDHQLLEDDPKKQEAGLAVYRESILGSRLQSMRKVFPCSLALIGEDCFQDLALEYIHKNPAKQPDVNQAHCDFSSFVAQHPLHETLPYLSSLIEFEYSWQTVFDSSPKIQDPDHLATSIEKAGDKIEFLLSPGSVLFRSEYPLIELRDLCLNKSEKELELNCYTRHYVIYRNNSQIAAQLLDINSLKIVQLLRKPLSFQSLCKKYFETSEKTLDEGILFRLLSENMLTWRLPE